MSQIKGTQMVMVVVGGLCRQHRRRFGCARVSVQLHFARARARVVWGLLCSEVLGTLSWFAKPLMISLFSCTQKPYITLLGLRFFQLYPVIALYLAYMIPNNDTPSPIYLASDLFLHSMRARFCSEFPLLTRTLSEVTTAPA